MKIDFNTIQRTAKPNFKGGEKEYNVKMFDDGLNKIMDGLLVPGASIGLHTHDTSSEIIFITGGSGKAIYDGKEERVSAGDCHYCPKGHAHTLINDGTENLTFLAVVPEQ
jgi:mannose-6-phosphate isomerase-like protein (cupin superfamily)